MMITTRNETFFKIEMTGAQADCLCQFVNALTDHQIGEICQREKISELTYEEIREAIIQFRHVLQRRNGS